MKKFWFALLFLMPLSIRAQISSDVQAQELILKGFDAIYNYNFTQTDEAIRQLQATYPQHPVVPLMKALELYWKYMPIKDNSAAVSQYRSYLNQGVNLSRQRLDRKENDAEGVFFALASHGYLGLQDNNEGELMKAVGEARKAYGYLKQGFDLMEQYPEFYFTTGLYNYYVEQYPEDHPVVKPVMLFFQNGNKALGLKQMETGVRKGVFTRAETGLYLGHIYLKHENQPGRAVLLYKPLADKYPKNPLFNLYCAESLMLAGHYAEAQPYIQRLKTLPQKFLQLPVRVLEGMTKEKLDNNARQAAVDYELAVKMPFDKAYTKEFSGHAYAGLARLAARAGDKNRAKTFYKKALDLAEYKSTIQEAKTYLKS